jgi:hypothetical protein
MGYEEDADYWGLAPGPERAALYGRLSAYHARRAVCYGERADRYGRSARRLLWLSLALWVVALGLAVLS